MDVQPSESLNSRRLYKKKLNQCISIKASEIKDSSVKCLEKDSIVFSVDVILIIIGRIIPKHTAIEFVLYYFFHTGRLMDRLNKLQRRYEKSDLHNVTFIEILCNFNVKMVNERSLNLDESILTSCANSF